MKFLVLLLVGTVYGSIVETTDGLAECRVDATGVQVGVRYFEAGVLQWQSELQADGIVVADVAFAEDRIIVVGAFSGELRIVDEYLTAYEDTTLFILTFSRDSGTLLSKLRLGGTQPALATSLLRQGDHLFLIGEYNGRFFSLALDGRGGFQPEATGKVKMEAVLPKQDPQDEPMYITQTSGSVVDTSGGTTGP